MFLAGTRLVALHLDQPSRCNPINVREREFLSMRERRLAIACETSCCRFRENYVPSEGTEEDIAGYSRREL